MCTKTNIRNSLPLHLFDSASECGFADDLRTISHIGCIHHQERILGALTPCSGALTPTLWQLPLEPLMP